MNSDKVKMVLGLKKDPNKDKISAREAHIFSKYGKDMSRKEILEDLIQEIRSYIKEDIKNGHLEHIFKISDKREKSVLEDVKKHFKEMGYDVIIHSDPIIFPITNLLIISWQREELENYQKEDPS